MSEDKSKPSRRQQILETLAHQLEVSPGQRITTATLAKAVGVSEAALYRHFPSKARMYEGLIEFIEDSLFGLIARIIEEESSGYGRCEKITALLLTFSERNPGITRIMIGDALIGENERLHTRIVQLFDRIESQYKQIMRESNLANELQREVHIASSANLFLALAEGRMNQYVRSHFKRKPTEDWQRQWQAMAAAIFVAPSAQ
ncbi:MAG: nucleoid occlusion factor SlmA [Gammaproteobacteria bacterium]|nr:nucleoid occlusion factor SlmA [Gammaproteobacteria bacterium]